MTNSKLSGRFYTPKALADWIVFYLSKHFISPIMALEPSCGDGIFINSLDASNISINYMDVVEFDSNAIKKIKSPTQLSNFFVHQHDFLSWETDKKYDLVIGNPPYIVRKLLQGEQSKLCRNIHINHGLKDYEVANIWTSFVLKTSSMINETGVLAFVLPTEILQVKYAKEIRSYLAQHFERIELITFKYLAFEDIEQDTVVLFAYKNCSDDNKGVFIKEIDGLSQLENMIPNFTHLPSSSLEQKWTTGILQEEDILLVATLATTIKSAKDYCNSVAGIVTAATNFFIVSKKKIKELASEDTSKPIIQRGFNIQGCIDFTQEKFNQLAQKNVPCFLIDTNGISKIHPKLDEYIKQGEALNIHERFKCKLRKRWHDVPGIKKGSGFFFKRSHDYPKCIKNSADVYVTDSAYQIVMKDGYNIESFIFSFYNSLTLLAAEMQGRYYGGGVLELTPNEFKDLPIPYTTCEDFKAFSDKFEKKQSIDELLISNDQIILSEHLGLTDAQIAQIQISYKKMKSRRMRAHN